jgi:hypothetical protein
MTSVIGRRSHFDQDIAFRPIGTTGIRGGLYGLKPLETEAAWSQEDPIGIATTPTIIISPARLPEPAASWRIQQIHAVNGLFMCGGKTLVNLIFGEGLLKILDVSYNECNLLFSVRALRQNDGGLNIC